MQAINRDIDTMSDSHKAIVRSFRVYDAWARALRRGDHVSRDRLWRSWLDSHPEECDRVIAYARAVREALRRGEVAFDAPTGAAPVLCGYLEGGVLHLPDRDQWGADPAVGTTFRLPLDAVGLGAWSLDLTLRNADEPHMLSLECGLLVDVDGVAYRVVDTLMSDTLNLSFRWSNASWWTDRFGDNS